MMNGSKGIAILSDSTCDLPADLIQAYSIFLVPQYVIFGTEELSDLRDIDAPGFYARLATDPNHPKTSRPTVQDFFEQVAAIKAAGYDEVVAVVVSDKLSGTVGSVTAAMPDIDIPFHLYDSRSVSLGLGWQLLAAARARDEGADASGIIAAADQVRQRLEVMFTVDTLEYLHRGGRIGGAARWFGTALQIKPALGIDHETGEVVAGERTRTRARALEYIADEISQRLVKRAGPARVAVMHGGAEADARSLMARLEGLLQPVETLFSHITPAIGVHGGPGVVGVAAYRAD